MTFIDKFWAWYYEKLQKQIRSELIIPGSWVQQNWTKKHDSLFEYNQWSKANQNESYKSFNHQYLRSIISKVSETRIHFRDISWTFFKYLSEKEIPQSQNWSKSMYLNRFSTRHIIKILNVIIEIHPFYFWRFPKTNVFDYINICSRNILNYSPTFLKRLIQKKIRSDKRINYEISSNFSIF